MTNKELIEKLSSLPGESEVFLEMITEEASIDGVEAVTIDGEERRDVIVLRTPYFYGFCKATGWVTE